MSDPIFSTVVPSFGIANQQTRSAPSASTLVKSLCYLSIDAFRGQSDSVVEMAETDVKCKTSVMTLRQPALLLSTSNTPIRAPSARKNSGDRVIRMKLPEGRFGANAKMPGCIRKR